jgi:hypothetical protein
MSPDESRNSLLIWNKDAVWPTLGKFCNVRFQVLTADSMKTTAFWDIAPCSLGEID